VHPIIDKIQHCENGGIEVFLKEHPSWEVLRIWKGLSNRDQERYRAAKLNHDPFKLIRLMTETSIKRLTADCEAGNIDDRKRQGLVKELCERVWLFGGGKFFNIKSFFLAIRVVERACKSDVREQDQLTVKEMINCESLCLFLAGVGSSRL